MAYFDGRKFLLKIFFLAGSQDSLRAVLRVILPFKSSYIPVKEFHGLLRGLESSLFDGAP